MGYWTNRYSFQREPANRLIWSNASYGTKSIEMMILNQLRDIWAGTIILHYFKCFLIILNSKCWLLQPCLATAWSTDRNAWNCLCWKYNIQQKLPFSVLAKNQFRDMDLQENGFQWSVSIWHALLVRENHPIILSWFLWVIIPHSQCTVPITTRGHFKHGRSQVFAL